MPALQRRFLLRSAAAMLAGGSLPFAAWSAAKIKPDAKSALIVVDVQNCFVSGGTLPVKHGEDVVPVINRIAAGFENVVLTQDWHTPGHASFASSHPARSRSRPSRCRTARRCCGPTTACRAPTTRRCART